MKHYIGIDNGVTGTIAIQTSDGEKFLFGIPTKSEQNYTKKKGNVTRIDVIKLKNIFDTYIGDDFSNSMLLLERPMVNPTRWAASLSAIRALEATLNVLEILKIPYAYIDSKEWQKVYLPSGLKGSAENKKASMDIGCRLFPSFKDRILKHKDADGLFISEYCKLKFRNNDDRKF